MLGSVGKNKVLRVLPVFLFIGVNSNQCYGFLQARHATCAFVAVESAITDDGVKPRDAENGEAGEFKRRQEGQGQSGAAKSEAPSVKAAIGRQNPSITKHLMTPPLLPSHASRKSPQYSALSTFVCAYTSRE